MIKRIYNSFDGLIEKKKVLVIYGARQVGKTTLLEYYLSSTDKKYRLESGENITVKLLFNSLDFNSLIEYATGYEILAIDEAQEIENIGKALKIIVDHVPDLSIIVTGSSSFNLSQNIGEPLTGRKITKTLYPLSHKELAIQINQYDLKEKLEEFLLFGMYPDVFTAKTKEKKIQILKELTDSYLLKDLFIHETVKSPKLLIKLLKLLAFQVGSEVSLNELGNTIGVDTKTVSRYLDLLEKCFVIKPLGGFSGNLRKEVTSKMKYYFIDNGIRNALISQFNELSNRNDTGALFENFIFMERLKKHEYENYYGNHYFWRTYTGQEIDIIEEIDGKLSAFECKYSEKKTVKIPKEWQKNYPESTFSIVNRKNYLDYIL